MTAPIDVSALAVAQMRAARAARDAYEACVLAKGGSDREFWEARAVWQQAAKALKAASRAYEAACDDVVIEPADDGQEELFG